MRRRSITRILAGLVVFLPFVINLPAQTVPVKDQRTEVWLYEGFESEVFPPSGWSRYNLQGPNRQWVRTNAFTYSGNGAALHHYHATEYQEGWLVSPLISLGSNSMLNFQEYTLNPAWYVYSGIWVSTGSGNPADGDFVELVEITDGVMEWTDRHISLNQFNGQDVYIAFLYEGLDAHSWYIDEVYVYSVSGLPGPAIAVSPAHQSSNVLISSTLNWAQVTVGPTPDGYRINLGTDYPPTNLENNTDLGNVFSYSPNELLDFSTTYYWQVIPYNANGDSPENPVWSFTTGPDPTLISPHVENFDEISTPHLPYMWNKIVNHTSTVAVVRTTTLHSPHSPPNHVEIYNTFTAYPNGILMLIPPKISEFSGHIISFYAKASAEGSQLVTGTMADPDDAASFNAVQTITLGVNYEKYIINLDDYTGGGNYFAFAHGEAGAGNGRRILIDDFAYYESSPFPSQAFAVTPVNNASNVLPGISLEWLAGPGEIPDGFILNFGTDYPPGNIENGTDLEGSTIYMPTSPLTPNTTHYWQIIPYNAAGQTPSPPVWTFTTGPDPTLIAPHYENFDDLTAPELPYGWDNIVIHSNIFAAVRTTHQYDPLSYPNHVELFNTFYSDPGQAHLLLITPQVAVFQDHIIRFYARTTPAGTLLEVGTISNPDNPDTFIPVEAIYPTNIYSEYTLSLNSFANGGSYIAFRHGEPGAGGGKRILIDDFSYEALPGIIPEIAVEPEAFNQEVFEGSQSVDLLTISNTGGAVLTFELASQVEGEEADWIQFMPSEGYVLPAGNFTVDVIFDASMLEPGIYTASILVNSNAPQNPQVIIPVEINVIELGLPLQVELFYPENGQAVELPPGIQEVELLWQPSFPAITNYHVEVALDHDFNDLIISNPEIIDTTFLLTEVSHNTTYYWRVGAQNPAGWGEFSEVWHFSTLLVGINDVEMKASGSVLALNYPNPFHELTTFGFFLKERCHVRLEIYNYTGRKETILLDEVMEAGQREVVWNATGIGGIYFYRIICSPVGNPGNSYTGTGKIVRIR